MNGSSGSDWQNNPESAETSSKILQALEIIHNPKSANSLRQKATHFLEEVRSDDSAPLNGFAISSNRSHPAIIRHYGLSLIEYAIRHRWDVYAPEKSIQLRKWVVDLAQDVLEGDPLYISNKIAELWVEVAKRSWALDWMDMDEILFHLWEGHLARKALVLNILETLSEDVFEREDFTAGLRGTELNRACIDCFTPAVIFRERLVSRDTNINVRYGEDGWLWRMGALLEWCIQENAATEPQRTCAIKAAVDALLTLYNRSRFSSDDFADLICPMYSHESTGALKQLFEWSLVDPSDIDEEKYLLSKKISEMVFAVGRHLEERPDIIAEKCDLSNYFDLLITIMKAQSLHTSIPALHLWVKLLSSEHYGRSKTVTSLAGQLLEICSHRMLRYESLPEDSPNPSIMFLNEDVDTVPERHAFLGNYSRFCHQIVEMIVERQPADALYHLLGQADQVLDHLYDGEPPFQVLGYSKTSIPVLRIDAQFSVIEAALKGYNKWLTALESGQNERAQETLSSNLQVWCERLLGLIFEDPLVLQRIVQLAVVFATGPLKGNAQFAFKVFDYSLNARRPDNNNSATYTEAIKELESFRLHQLQRLAMRFPDYFITIFDAVEQKVNEIALATATDDHTRIRYSSVLFIIIHRATAVDQKQREEKLDYFLDPLIAQWHAPSLSNSLSSFNGFCELLGLGSLQQYALSRVLASSPNENISKSQAFHDPAQWLTLPPEATGIVRRILTDRFWQVGISSGTRDDFYAQVGDTKSTLEGLASSVRGSIRTVREIGYRILYYFSLLGEPFYCFEGLPEPLARALFTNACALSTHQMAVLVDTIRPIIENCPAVARGHFLPPILIGLFEQLDRKTGEEWDRIETKTNAASADDNLSEEMRDESILRQLTYSSVILIVGLLDPDKPVNGTSNAECIEVSKALSNVDTGTTRSYVLTTPAVLKPVILFCTHALRMRDTRSCNLIARVLRSLIPDFAGPSAVATEVREFISTEVLKACITSLHDPYFVDLQKDLAQLIASIVLAYVPRTDTPKQVLLSLPSITGEKMGRFLNQLHRVQESGRQQRALVLSLLDGLRGTHISEQGKIPKPDLKSARSALHEKYMSSNMEADRKQQPSPELAGVADMFN
ncbi:MAG: hypothetical protein Q9195_000249 [Heterodermia aff. obscurata]